MKYISVETLNNGTDYCLGYYNHSIFPVPGRPLTENVHRGPVRQGAFTLITGIGGQPWAEAAKVRNDDGFTSVDYR